MISEPVLKLAGYLISIIFLYLAFKDTNINLILKNLDYISFYYIFIIVLLTVTFYLIRSLYQQNNLKYVNPKLSFSISLQAIVLTYFYNNILPARLGEIVRAFYLSKKQDARKASILSYILIEKIIDVVFILSILLIIIIVETNSIEIINRIKILPLLLFFLVLLISIFLYFNHQIANIFKFIVPGKYYSIFSRINSDIHQGLNCFRSINQVIKAIILLLSGWVLVISIYYFISIPYIELMELPSYAFIYFLVFTSLALTIPSAPAGIGVVHYGLFFSVSILNPDIINTNIDLVAACIIAIHFYIFIIDIITSGSIIILQKFNRNLRKIS